MRRASRTRSAATTSSPSALRPCGRVPGLAWHRSAPAGSAGALLCGWPFGRTFWMHRRRGQGKLPERTSAAGGSDETALGAGAGPRWTVVVGGAPAGAATGAGGAGGGGGGGGRLGAEPAAGPCRVDGGGGLGAVGAARRAGGATGSGGSGGGSGSVAASGFGGGGEGVEFGGAGGVASVVGAVFRAVHQGMATPPFGRRIWPVMKAEASEARCRTVWATSSGSPTRPSGEIRAIVASARC